MPPGQQLPPSDGAGGGGVVKWLVIGCLGCAGIAVLGFLALILLAVLDGGGDEGNSSPTTTATAGPSDGGGESSEATDENAGEGPEESTSSEPNPADPSGATSETDSVKVSILSTERTQELQDSLWEHTTSNEYFVIDISYTNKSSESITLLASDVVLIDSDGKEYDANTDVSLAVETPIIIEEINPGLTYEGTLVFEVPPGQEFTELRFKEDFGTGADVTIAFE